MNFSDRASATDSTASGPGTSPTSTTGQSGLTSSRNPDRHGLRWQEAIGVLSWGALSFVAILFVGADSPREIIIAWVVALFVATWFLTALAARTVRRFPTQHRGQDRDRRR